MLLQHCWWCGRGFRWTSWSATGRDTFGRRVAIRRCGLLPKNFGHLLNTARHGVITLRMCVYARIRNIFGTWWLPACRVQCGDIRPVCVDLCDWHDTQSAVKSLGPLDLLVNNAGVGDNKPFVDVTVENFDWQVAALLSEHRQSCCRMARPVS